MLLGNNHNSFLNRLLYFRPSLAFKYIISVNPNNWLTRLGCFHFSRWLRWGVGRLGRSSFEVNLGFRARSSWLQHQGSLPLCLDALRSLSPTSYTATLKGRFTATSRKEPVSVHEILTFSSLQVLSSSSSSRPECSSQGHQSCCCVQLFSTPGFCTLVRHTWKLFRSLTLLALQIWPQVSLALSLPPSPSPLPM